MALRFLSGLVPPTSDSDPREALEWVRRFEIVTGLISIAAGIAMWNSGWLHWPLIGLGVLGLSPWPGARTILRKADRKPGVLVTDRERGRERGRRAVQIQIPLYAIAGFGIGYVFGGLGVAIVVGVVMGLSALLGAWLYLRRMQP